MGKVFSRFEPTPTRTPEERERHYTQVHVRMAQDLLRPMPSLEADRPPSIDPEQAWAAFGELAERVRVAMDGAFGARALIVNRLVNEVECEPVDVEGQRPVGILEETTRVGYIEAYFDHRRWGEETLGPVACGGALNSPALVDVNLLGVDEMAPLDLRFTR